MHYVSVAYPDNPTENDKEHIKNFFLSIGNVLPCATCRYHFSNNLKNFPLSDTVLSTRCNLINWLKDIHNEVNIRHNKKPWTYDDVIKKYTQNNSYTIEIISITLLIVIIIIIIVYMKYIRQKIIF
jgi:hypothetical protein